MLIIHLQGLVFLATTLSSWWLSSLLLQFIILPNRGIIAAAAIPDLQFVRSQQRQRHRRRRAQDNNNNINSDGGDDNHTTVINVDIVGGDVVPQSNYPFYAYVFTGNATTAGLLCGGTLIHPDIVLTAAHCADRFTTGRRVYIGGDMFSLEVEKTFAHPSYIAATSLNNIMLVKLKGNASSIHPVRLNRLRFLSWPGRAVSMIGYGVTSDNGSGSFTAELRRATLRLATRAQCKANFGTNYDTRSELCAGVRRGGKGACTGDGGGPLLVGNRVQHGIISFGNANQCAASMVSDVTTRVSTFYNWIWYYTCHNTDVKIGECAHFV